jgi:hypothetical protein
MPIDDQTIREQGERALLRATQWCYLAWACLLGGILSGKVTSELKWDLATVLCHCFVGAGILFLIYTALMSLAGLLFSGRFSRLRFAGLLLLSICPFLGFHILCIARSI